MTPQNPKINYTGERPSPLALALLRNDLARRAASLELNKQVSPAKRLWRFVRQGFGL